MKVKNILIGGGLIAAGYCVGNVIGHIQFGKLMIDGVEEMFPGAKKNLAHKFANNIVDGIFKDKKEKDEEEA